ncbi:MAG: nucleotide sugar dehydrogenase [Chloroflexota bacterium]
MTTINVLGLGYTGLPTAGMFATHGFQVTGVDVNEHIIRQLKAGAIHVKEYGLSELIQVGLNSGCFIPQTEPSAADVYIIAVPSPITAEKEADLSYVEAATKAIVPHVQPGNLVILESTVPPGTTKNVLAPILSQSGLDTEKDLLIAHSPERVLPGRILEELVNNDRVVGGLTPEAAIAARDLYAVFVQGEIYLTDATSAEMIKLMENTYRDVNIALANEFALVAEAIDVNVWDAIDIANCHPRVNVLKPGPGVGGHCIAVDPWFLVQAAPSTTQLIASARRFNDQMPQRVAERVQSILTDAPNPQIAALGLTYKADVDDARGSPALDTISCLQSMACEVRAFDPYLPNTAFAQSVESVEAAVSDADCLLILTDHQSFQSLNPATIGQQMRSKIMVDTRNAMPHDIWREAGFMVYVLGSPLNRP